MPRCVKSRLLVLALMTFLTVPVGANCPAGDLNGDCQVNSEDLRVFAEHWLDPPGSPVDLNGDDQVSAGDLAVLATHWRETGIPLAINEVMASNSSQIPDPQGEYDDWIEIHNFGDEPINVGSMYLTDDLDDPTKWRIPDGSPPATTIGAGGYLLVWADNDVGDSGLHANFRLDAGGDDVALFGIDGRTPIDSISFGDQSADISFGRYP
ncbi:MAG: lamin tail domain-containing protein, partial [Phycisphaerales bacterium]